MIGEDILRALLLAALLVFAGCGGAPADPSAEPAEAEATSGGEAPAGAASSAEEIVVADAVDVRDPWAGLVELGPDPRVVTGDEASRGESPWGQSRSEQCRRAPRPALAPAARASFEAGVAAARRGEYDTAFARFQEALAADPGAADVAYDLGVLADRRGDETAALEYYRRALTIAPDHEGAALGTVTIHRRRNALTTALAFIEPLARAHANSPYLQALNGEVLVAIGRYSEAWTTARRALACDERFIPALVVLVKASDAQGRTELAESILEQALEISDASPELHYRRGVALRGRSGFLQEALTELRRAVELRPDYAEARVALATQLLDGGNYAEAVQHLEVAHRLLPGSVEVQMDLGDAYRANRQFPQALEQFQAVLRARPNLEEAHYDLALTYHAGGAELPGLSELEAFHKAVEEMEAYQRAAGARAADDPSNHYIQLWRRQIERLEHRRALEAQEAAAAAARSPEGGQAPATDAAPPPAGGDDDVQFFK